MECFPNRNNVFCTAARLHTRLAFTEWTETNGCASAGCVNKWRCAHKFGKGKGEFNVVSKAV